MTTTNTLDDLVKRLGTEQAIECSRPEKTAEALRLCIDRNYVHVLLKATGTEIGVLLDRKSCQWNPDDLKNGKGIVRLVGGLTLNFNRVRCEVVIDLASCEGRGKLTPVNEEEYKAMLGTEPVF
jgi:hypothetical protein